MVAARRTAVATRAMHGRNPMTRAEIGGVE